MVDASKEIVRGLAGILVSTTSMSKVDGVKGELTYRGYDIHDLAKYSSFEETCYLLFNGELPNETQLTEFTNDLNTNRDLPEAVLTVLRALPTDAHPMAVLRTAVSAYGCTDANEAETTVENFKTIGAKLVAQVATMAAAVWRLRSGLEPIAPNHDLGYAANFLYMMTGEIPSEEDAKLMDVSLICHADHGIPASTFSGMVVVSSLTDLYSAISAAIGSLKGPLHGGANEQVLINLDAIGDASNVPAYMEKVRAEKIKVPGIGHRVYKTYDPRAVIFKELAKDEAERHPEILELYKTATALEDACVEEFGSKQLYPNVDYFSGIIYRGLSIDPLMFTPIFAVSRMAGWVARLIEYLPQNRIFRPKGQYEGSELRPYPSSDSRKNCA